MTERWSYDKVVDEFEDLLSQARKECDKQRHKDQKERYYDIAHVAIAYLCDKCHLKFIWDWNAKLLPHVSKWQVEEIKEWQERMRPRLTELGITI